MFLICLLTWIELDVVFTEKRRPFLDMLLIENKKGAGLSDLEIRNEVDTFMVAVISFDSINV